MLEEGGYKYHRQSQVQMNNMEGIMGYHRVYQEEEKIVKNGEKMVGMFCFVDMKYYLGD